ncbi:MAG: 1-acyl-sn-glycerol-3-phosphate acyltransferase [Clostridiales bacterium]|nr:1-acyl-sn-glycerol-3-phosphate acyltransferase [Clostridiales bacterium]
MADKAYIKNGRHQKADAQKYIPGSESHLVNSDTEHIVKMWTPLHFTTPESYNFFPKGPVFQILNITLRWVIYIFGPVIFKIFFGLRVIGKEKLKALPKRGVTVCNHVHMLDCGIVACHMNRRRICIPTLESNFCMPVVRHLIRILGGVPLPERVRPFRKMHKALAEHINRGNLVHIYPEAVLYPRYNGIRGFKRGAFFLAYDCDVPVIPYVIRYVKPQGLQRFFHRKLVMRLYILDPVYPDTKRNKKDETTRLCEEVQKRMKDVFEHDTF